MRRVASESYYWCWAGGCGWLANNWVETHNDSRDCHHSARNTPTHHSLETSSSINSQISHSLQLASSPNFHWARAIYSRITRIFSLPHTSIFPLFFLDWSQRQGRKVYLAIAALCIYSLRLCTVSQWPGPPGPGSHLDTRTGDPVRGPARPVLSRLVTRGHRWWAPPPLPPEIPDTGHHS